MSAYFWENLTYLLNLFVNQYFLAMLWHKIPKHILKPLLFVVFENHVCISSKLSFWKTHFHYYSKKAIFRKVAYNNQQTRKHITPAFAQKIAQNHYNRCWIILVQNLTFKLVQNLTFKGVKIGPEPNFTTNIYIYIWRERGSLVLYLFLVV